MYDFWQISRAFRSKTVICLNTRLIYGFCYCWQKSCKLTLPTSQKPRPIKNFPRFTFLNLPQKLLHTSTVNNHINNINQTMFTTKTGLVVVTMIMMMTMITISTIIIIIIVTMLRWSGLVVEHRTRNGEVAGSTHTRSTASNLQQVANLLCAQANSASNPQRDGKRAVATATGWRPSVADWGNGVSASCTMDPIVR